MNNQSQNSETATPKRSPAQYISLITFGLFGGFCGVMITAFVGGNQLAEGRFGVRLLMYAGLLIFMYVAIVAQLIFHEAGHLIAGLLSGYKFSSFRVFSFMWLRDGSGVRLCRLSIAGTGGQCLMTPPPMKDGKIPVSLYNLGGPLMNLILAIVPAIISIAVGIMTLPGVLLMIFAAAGLTFSITNGVPMHTSTVDNDGYNAIALRHNEQAMQAFAIQMQVAGMTARGVRLRDCPAEWFAVPSDEDMKNSMVATRGVLACNRLMDEEKFEQADRLMKHMLGIESGIIGVHRNLLICDRMYIELITECRHEVIDAMRTQELLQFMKLMKKFPSVLRTQYACSLLYERNTAAAAEIKKQFELCAGRYPYPSDIQSERELMTIAESRQ